MAEDITKIQLTSPIEAHGEKKTELEFRKLSAGLLRKIKGNLATDLIDMACQFAGIAGDIPTSSVNSISAKDLMGLVVPAFLELLESSQETTNSSAQT